GCVAGTCKTTGCTPLTVDQACTVNGYNCGPVGDGCGGTVNCGTCPSGQSCGVFGPNKCGVVG
ncbi:MAG TPA: hypothetical protein PKI49_07695, partial [Pseudomonadota bacterium]|nr:hypothetical protein [Pseudomonadota bacterium]